MAVYQIDDFAGSIEAAADWWTQQVAGKAKLDNGDDSPHGLFGHTMATMLQDKAPPRTEGQLEAFKGSLIRQLVEAIQPHMGGERAYSVSTALRVDYDPDRTLAQALQDAEIHNMGVTLPWKTRLFLDHAHVRVKSGYAADYEVIYVHPDYKPCELCNATGYLKEPCPTCKAPTETFNPECPDMCYKGETAITCTACSMAKYVRK